MATELADPLAHAKKAKSKPEISRKTDSIILDRNTNGTIARKCNCAFNLSRTKFQGGTNSLGSCVPCDIGQALLDDTIARQTYIFVERWLFSWKRNFTSNIAMSDLPLVDQMSRRVEKPDLVQNDRTHALENPVILFLDRVRQGGYRLRPANNLPCIALVHTGGGIFNDARGRGPDPIERGAEFIVQFTRELFAFGFLNGHQTIDEEMIVGFCSSERSRKPIELLANLPQFHDPYLAKPRKLSALKSAKSVAQFIEQSQRLPSGKRDQRYDCRRNES